MQLEAKLLPNEETRVLPNGAAIDLDPSRLPASWNDATPFDSDNDSLGMNILFSPQGTVIGNEVAAGLIHFVIRDRRDIEADRPERPLGDATAEGGETIVTVSPQTGAITTHDIFFDAPIRPATRSRMPKRARWPNETSPYCGAAVSAARCRRDARTTNVGPSLPFAHGCRLDGSPDRHDGDVDRRIERDHALSAGSAAGRAGDETHPRHNHAL